MLPALTPLEHQTFSTNPAVYRTESKDGCGDESVVQIEELKAAFDKSFGFNILLRPKLSLLPKGQGKRERGQIHQRSNPFHTRYRPKCIYSYSHSTAHIAASAV